MTTPDNTEDFTAASSDPDAGSARWARRRLVMRPPIPRRRRGRRALETAPFDAKSNGAGHTGGSQSNGGHAPTHRLEGFDLRSVASTALLYYGCVFVVLTLGVMTVWFGASMFGVVGRVEEFMRGIGFRAFRFDGVAVIL